MARVYVSIGSNIEREKNMRSAIRALRARFGELQLSPLYQSAAQGFTGEDFYNLVAAFDSDAAPEDVKAVLVQIESDHGRRRGGERFAPRTLDIDLLLYGRLIRHDRGIDVPRKEITQWAFVLGPLAELAPLERHPETGERFTDLWTRFEQKDVLHRVTLDLEA